MTAGNNGSRASNTVTWPAKHDNVISVGGCTEYGKRMEMSAVGREIDFLCPGQNILSTGKKIKVCPSYPSVCLLITALNSSYGKVMFSQSSLCP